MYCDLRTIFVLTGDDERTTPTVFGTTRIGNVRHEGICNDIQRPCQCNEQTGGRRGGKKTEDKK